MLFYLTFFHNADVCIFAKTTALFNYIFIQDKSVVFTVSMKFAILKNLQTHVYEVKALHGCRDSTVMAKIRPDFKDLPKKDKNHFHDKQES